MPLRIVENDITKMNVDVIVNAANESLLGGGGVDGAIHAAAGHELLEECKTLGGCKTGCVKLTKGYNLPSKYVIHAVGPIYCGGDYNEEELLISCYKSSLLLAKEINANSIAFPLISAGVYGYPIVDAIEVAIKTIKEFLKENDIDVYLVIYDKRIFEIRSNLFIDIENYIFDVSNKVIDNDNRCLAIHSKPGTNFDICYEDRVLAAPSYIDDIEIRLDESFAQMLFRKIDEKGISDVECYKRANVDRKLFSKIRSNIHYKVSKPTAIAFAVALELDLKETNELLSKAGFTLTHSKKFDIIIEYFIKNKIYDIFEINKILFKFDESLLGAK